MPGPSIPTSLNDGANRSQVGSDRSNIAIETGSEKTTATVGVRAGATSADGTDSWVFGLAATAPFDQEKDQQKAVGTLSGLTAGSSAKLAISWLRWPRSHQSDVNAICADAIGRLFPGKGWIDRDLAAGEDKSRYLNFGGEGGQLQQVQCKDIVLDRGRLATLLKAYNLANDADLTLPDEQRFKAWSAPVLEQFAQPGRAGRPRALTVEFTMNRQDFEYSSETAPAEFQSDTKEGYGAALTYSSVRQRSVTSIGYQWERTYAGAETLQVCSPLADDGSLRCAEGALGGPQLKEQQIVFAEWRAILPSPLNGIAMGPRVEYSPDESSWAFRLPIYLARNSAQQFTGGIALNWDQDTDGAVTVFVGKAFDLFGG